MTYQPRHVRALYLRSRLEAVPGTSEAPLSDSDDWNNTIRSIRYDFQEREVSETRGPGSRMIQSQELLARRYPITIEWEVHNADDLVYTGWDTGNDEIYSLTFETCSEVDYGQIFWGAKCNSLRLSATERSVLVAEAEYLALHCEDGAGFTWTEPQYRPFVFAQGNWVLNDEGLAEVVGEISGFDIRMDNNIHESYVMGPFDSRPSDLMLYDPKYLIGGGFRASCDLTLRTPIDMTDQSDAMSAELYFEGSPGILRITLSDGIMRGNQLDAPQDDLIGYTVPMVFRDIQFANV